MEKSKFEQWAETRFEGLSGDELREAGAAYGLTFPRTTTHKEMRIRLCEASGQALPKEMEEAGEQPPTAPPRMGRPGLGPTEKWEGRRHRVMIHHSEENRAHKAVCLTWNMDTRAFEFDKVIDMPEPWFNILHNSTIREVMQRKIKDGEGNLIRMESYDVPRRRYSYDYHGITPGTEHLPGSILEFWQQKAKANDYFKKLAKRKDGLGRRALITILRDVTETKGPDYYKDKTDEELHLEILQTLGFEEVAFADVDVALLD